MVWIISSFSYTSMPQCKMVVFLLVFHRAYWWLCARLQYLHCISSGDTAVLHKAISMMLILYPETFWWSVLIYSDRELWEWLDGWFEVGRGCCGWVVWSREWVLWVGVVRLQGTHLTHLTHWDWNKMAAILLTTFSTKESFKNHYILMQLSLIRFPLVEAIAWCCIEYVEWPRWYLGTFFNFSHTDVISLWWHSVLLKITLYMHTFNC